MVDITSPDLTVCRGCGCALVLSPDELAPGALVDAICWPCDHGYTAQADAARVGPDLH